MESAQICVRSFCERRRVKTVALTPAIDLALHFRFMHTRWPKPARDLLGRFASRQFSFLPYFVPSLCLTDVECVSVEFGQGLLSFGTLCVELS